MSTGIVDRKKLSRGKFLSFLEAQPPCMVAMEACAGAHHWGREIRALGHEVRHPGIVKVDAIIIDYGRFLVRHGDLMAGQRLDDRPAGDARRACARRVRPCRRTCWAGRRRWRRCH